MNTNLLDSNNDNLISLVDMSKKIIEKKKETDKRKLYLKH